MKKIELDASGWTSIGAFYDALLPALEAPEGHGRSINAMIGSVIGGSMNGVESPFVIEISGTKSLSKPVLDHLETAKFYLVKACREMLAGWDQDVEATIEIVRWPDPHSLSRLALPLSFCRALLPCQRR